MKKLLLIFSCIFILTSLIGCRKTYHNPSVPFVFNWSPVKKGLMELNTSFFLALPDNSFLISCKSPGGSYLDREVFLHYDENLRFLDSTYYLEDVFFGNGLVKNGSIFNVFLQANSQKTKWNFTVLETDFNFKKRDQSGNLMDSINAIPLWSFPPQIIQLQNGTLVTGINKLVNVNQRKVHLMAFNQGLHSAALWENDSTIAVNFVAGNILRSMASDGNYFYVLCYDYANFNKGVLRKHDENGHLIWAREMPYYFGKTLLVQANRIVLFGNGAGLTAYDKEGNLLESYSYKGNNFVTDGSLGLVDLNTVSYPAPNFATRFETVVTKYNAEFLPIKTRLLGDDFAHNCILGRMQDGSYMVVISMNINEKKGEQLVFFRLDGDLNNYFK
ncbi:MAG: hypothetical protein SGJ00_13465 [bacterium]|nr:hypothetical protein [bacterium]